MVMKQQVRKNMVLIIHPAMIIQFLSVPLVVAVHGVIGPLIILLLIWQHLVKVSIVPLLVQVMNLGMVHQWLAQMPPVYMAWFGRITQIGQMKMSETRFQFQLTPLFMTLIPIILTAMAVVQMDIALEPEW